MAPSRPRTVGYDCGACAPLPVPGPALLHLIRPAILLLAVVLASPATAATLEEQAASAAVLESGAGRRHHARHPLAAGGREPGRPDDADRGGDPGHTVRRDPPPGGARRAPAGPRITGLRPRRAERVAWRAGPRVGRGNEVWLAHLGEVTAGTTCDTVGRLPLALHRRRATFGATPSTRTPQPAGRRAPAHVGRRPRGHGRDGQRQRVDPVVGGVDHDLRGRAARADRPFTEHAVAHRRPRGYADGPSIDSFAGRRWPSVVSLPDERIVIVLPQRDVQRSRGSPAPHAVRPRRSGSRLDPTCS